MSRADSAPVGMTIFLGSLAMLFAALLLAYAVVRVQAPAWPPAGVPRLPRAVLAANTLALVASSLALRAAIAAAAQGLPASANRRLALALALGATFLAAQTGVWRGLTVAGLGPASSLYGSAFFALSGFHALHVLGGLVALAVVAMAAGGRQAARLRLLAGYWDFVLVVWLVLYLAVCVA